MTRSDGSPATPIDIRGDDFPPARRAWYAVSVLTLIYIFSYIDRTILTLLVTPIREDLQISDTQISLLHGFAFALFYTLFGFPLGRLADRGRRVTIISIGVLVWSVMTVLSGLARSFGQLFAARMGVGVGEAALSPSAYSIIADYFPPDKLSRALSVYVMGTYVGMASAYAIGGAVVGALNDLPPLHVPLLGPLEGWRIAFLVAGLPGIFLAGLIFTVKEPRRIGVLRSDAGASEHSFPKLFGYLSEHKWTYAATFVGFGLLGLLINGMALWTPTFLIRIHGWSAAEAGAVYGLMIGIFGGSGVVAGGWFSDHLQKRGETGACFIAATIASACAIVPTALMPLMASTAWILGLMGPALFFGSMPFGLAVSALQQITPNQLRGQISAIYLFFSSLLGIGFGPLAVALVTDFVFGDDQRLGDSMAIVGGGVALLATLILFAGIRAYRMSVARADEWAIDIPK